MALLMRPSAGPLRQLSEQPAISYLRGAGHPTRQFRYRSLRSTHTSTQTLPKPQPHRILLRSAFGTRNTLYTLLFLTFSTGAYLYITDTRASLHSWLISPTLRLLAPDAETAHHLGIRILSNAYTLNLHPRERSNPDADNVLSTDLWDTTLSNPLAISAGLDKNGEAISPLFATGAAIIEIGGVTPLPQYGNPKPRVWRIPSQAAIVNRYGLNSQGADAVALTLRKRVRAYADSLGYGVASDAEERVLNGEAGVPAGSLQKGKLLAVQIAKNKDTPDSDQDAVVADYVTCVKKLGVYADVIVVNVSSPNTPGLRSLQSREPLTTLLSAVVGACENVERKQKPRVMVKVSPDESSESDINGICAAVWQSGVDGVIVANTTKSRPSPPFPTGALTREESRALKETGGYSGPALFPKTLELVRKYRKTLDLPLRQGGKDAEHKVIFASGGICTGDDALEVLKAGASVAMSYTAFSYYGSGFVTEVKTQMRRRILEGERGATREVPSRVQGPLGQEKPAAVSIGEAKPAALEESKELYQRSQGNDSSVDDGVIERLRARARALEERIEAAEKSFFDNA